MTGENRELKTDNYYELSGNFGIGHMSGGTIEKGAKVAGIINEATPQDLAKIAQVLQELLDYFEQNPELKLTEAQAKIKTIKAETPEIMDAEIVESSIESNPPLKERIRAAGEASFIETIKVLLPPVGIAIEAIKAFKNPQ